MPGSVCIIDFNGYERGTHRPVSYWADYYPDKGQLVFGGDMEHIPPLDSETEPTYEAALGWAQEHGGYNGATSVQPEG